MPVLWLRVALAWYALGLLYALVAVARRSESGFRRTIPALWLGATFHLVSLVETTLGAGRAPTGTLHYSESLLAFLIAAFFLAIWTKYKASTPGVFVFPLVLILTLAAAVGQQPPGFSSPLLRRGWILAHVALIFVGYAALFLSFVASLLYLLQERRLKRKQPNAPALRMPALEVIDEIGYRSLLLGFPFMTLGLIAGSVLAQVQFGATFFHDPKIALAIVAWAIYMLLLVTRWSAGWRGRKAAFLSTAAFLAAVVTWAANYLSETHRFLG